MKDSIELGKCLDAIEALLDHELIGAQTMIDTVDRTFILTSGYSHSGKDKEPMTFRNPVDIAEIVSHCNSHSHIYFRDARNQDQYRKCKVNGKVRTWKRDHNRIEVPVKYGVYEYGIFRASDIERILIPR